MMHPPRTNSGNPDPGPPSFTYHLIQIVQIIECNNEMREQMGPFPWMKIQIREEMCGEYQRLFSYQNPMAAMMNIHVLS